MRIVCCTVCHNRCLSVYVQMRVEELEAVCHAASFESSLRRAMAHTSPVCSVSASTDSNDSSQSFIRADHDADQADAATSSFQAQNFGTPLRSNGTDRQNTFGTGFRQTAHGQDSGSLDADEEEYLRRDADSMSQSSSETEISGLKQQQHEWETEREELLREMGNLRSVRSDNAISTALLCSSCLRPHASQHSQMSWLSSISLGTVYMAQECIAHIQCHGFHLTSMHCAHKKDRRRPLTPAQKSLLSDSCIRRRMSIKTTM